MAAALAYFRPAALSGGYPVPGRTVSLARR